MKVTRIFAALALVACFAGAAHAAAPGCVRLSWGSCDPWNMDKPFSAAIQNLVVSAFGVGDDNIGTDITIHIRPAVPDAWRFDDGGCQCPTPATCGLNPVTNSFNSKSCPVMKGANALAITNYSIVSGGQVDLRLAITYDPVVGPVPSQRYTLWQVLFDHTFSNVGPSPPDHSTCGGAEQCEQFLVTNAALLALSGQAENMAGCDVGAGVPAATWNGGSNCPVGTQNSTWGKMKGLYR